MHRLVAILEGLLAAGLLLLSAAAPAAAQDPGAPSALPPGVVARVHGRDVTEAALLERLARTYEHGEQGRKALDEIVDDLCVHREAARRGVAVSQAEIDSYMQRWDERIKQQSGGRASLQDLYEEASSREEFVATAREFLLREKMARQDLGTKPEEDLQDRYMKLWLSSLRRRMEVRYDGLGEGELARVGDAAVTRADLARRLREKLPRELVAAVANELVIALASEHAAAEAGIRISDDDVEAALADMRRRFAEDPQVKGSGLGFDQFLRETRGIGEDDLRRDTVFRARIALQVLMERDVGDAEVAAFYARNEDAYGERALVRQVFVQSGHEGDEFATRTRESAWQVATAAKIAVIEAAGLHLPEAERPRAPLGPVVTRVAKRYADGEEARRRAGEPVAWTRLTVHGESALERAVFEGPIGELQGPLRSSVGYHVLVVEERRPKPTFEEIAGRVRADVVEHRINEFQTRYRGDDTNVVRAY